MQAAEALRARVAQVELGEAAPQRDRRARQPRALDAAVPAHRPRQRGAPDAIRQQEVEPFVLGQALGDRAGGHGFVNSIGYQADMNEVFVLSATALAALAAVAPLATRRLQLSLAKHPSLSGHARMARR